MFQRLAGLADDYLTGGVWLDEACLRLEPMLACMVTGFTVCNLLNRRTEMTSLLHSCLPPLLAIFFFSTGVSMRIAALRRTWPTALTLFGARILALWVGTFTGTALADMKGSSGGGGGASAGSSASSSSSTTSSARPPSPPAFASADANSLESKGRRRELQCCGWAAFVTQAGITLGLSDEIADAFPTWGPSLQAPLVASIVLSQLVGPPLLAYALRASGEAREGAPDEKRSLLLGGDRGRSRGRARGAGGGGGMQVAGQR